MRERITLARLESLCAIINRETGMPPASYLKDAEGKLHPQAGNYKIGGAYGGYRLERMSLTPGCTGESDISPRLSKAALYEWMQAFRSGLRAAPEKGDAA